METIEIEIGKLNTIIKNAVKEAIVSERQNLFELLMPQVSDEEMSDIILKHGVHPNDSDLIDLTEWLRNES